jgi:hypothetical protein
VKAARVAAVSPSRDNIGNTAEKSGVVATKEPEGTVQSNDRIATIPSTAPHVV